MAKEYIVWGKSPKNPNPQESMKQYTYISDLGHGWLEVPETDFPANYRPSEFSYHSEGMAYLEEDSDAIRFLRAAGLLVNGMVDHESVTIQYVNLNHYAPCRGYPRF